MILHRLRRIRVPRGQVWRVLAVIVGAIILLILPVVVINLILSDISHAKDLAAIVQSGFTVVAIVVGGVLAFYKLQIFRDFEPHLTISNSISHRLLGTKYVHVAVTATLHNSSKVKVEIRSGFFRLQQLAPASDEEVERLYAQVFTNAEEEYLQWPILDQVRRSWNVGELIVEPGESHSETFEFVVATEIESVIIYTYFYNPQHSPEPRSTEGWYTTAIYDIIRKA